MATGNTTIGIRLAVEGEQQVKAALGDVEQKVEKLTGAVARAGHYGVSYLALKDAVLPFAASAVRAADAVTTLNNQLKLATGSTLAAGQAYAALFDIAQSSRVSFTELGSTFAAISRAGQELGISQSRLLSVTEAIGNAMTVSGGSAQGMQAALTQLGQGLASGTLRGEELNSVMEQTPRLAKALADGLGVPIGKLREMGAAGQITAQQVIKALESQAAVLRGEVQGAVLTVAQSFTQLENATVKAVGELDKATGTSAALAQGISNLSGFVGTLGKAFAENEAAIKTTLGLLAGAGVAAGLARTGAALGGVATGVGGVAAAVTALKVVVSGLNPATAALLGIGTVMGAAAGYESYYKGTQEGIKKTIADLEAANAKASDGLGRMQSRPEITTAINKAIADRTAQIQKLRAELSALEGKTAPVGSVGSGDTALTRAQAAENTRLAASYDELRARLSGFKGDYAKYAADLQAIQAGMASGAIGRAEGIAMLTDLAKKHGEVAKAAKDSKPYQDQLAASADAYSNAMKKLIGNSIEAEAASAGYTKTQKDLLEIFSSPGFAGMPDVWKQTVVAQAEAIIAAEQLADTTKALALTEAALAKAELARIEAAEKGSASVQAKLQALQDEEKALVIASAQNISLAQAIEEVEIARLREQQAALLRIGDRDIEVLAIQREIDARKELKTAIGSKEAREAADSFAKDAALAWQKASADIERSLTDALLRGFESGKGFAANLRDTIKNMFSTLVLRPIVSAVVTPLAGAVTGSLGLAGAAQAGQGVAAAGGGASSAAGMLGNLGNLGTIGATMGAFGTGMAASFTSMVSAGVSGWATAAGSLIGTGAASGIAAGLGMIAAPLAAAAVLYKPLFGRTLKDQGIQGEFGGEAGFTGENYQFFKGGLLRSNKTTTSALDPAMAAGLADGYKTLQVSVGDMSKTLGLSAKALDTYTRKIKFSTNGLTQEQAAARLKEEFDSLGDEMAQLVLSTTAYTKAGESSSAALARLSSSLSGVNDTLALLGRSLYGADLAGADMASKLADVFGGLATVASASQAYFAAYYTEAEKAATGTRLLAAQFADIGMALPATRGEFRALVDGLDLTTDGGRKTYAQLLQLAPAFDSATAAVEAAAKKTVASILGAQGMAPAIDAAAIRAMQTAVALTYAGTQQAAYTTAVKSIHTVLGDASSGVLTFTDAISGTSTTLSPAQQAVAALSAEIDAIGKRSDLTAAGVRALGAALANVDAVTFTAALADILDRLATQLRSVFDGIMTERVAVRQAAIGMADPQAYSYTLLQSQIANQRVALPNDAALRAASQGLSGAAAAKDAATGALGTALGVFLAAQIKQATTKGRIAAAEAEENRRFAQLGGAWGGGFTVDANGKPVWSSTEMNGQTTWRSGGWAQIDTVQAMHGDTKDAWYNFFQKGGASPSNQDPNAPWNLLTTLGKTYAADKAAADAARSVYDAALAKAGTAQAALANAEAKQRDEAAKYAAALTTYASASATATANLSRLREETVKYYEQQKNLADLMGRSATALRATVADYRFSQLTEAAQYTQRLGEYDKAYSLALSTTGEARAGYADQMNAVLPQLLQLADATGNTNAIATLLARAEAVAKGLEDTLPRNYQAESLGLLADIDSTLAALGDGTQILVRAIDAGRDKTADGLRAVVAALTGKPIPAFATGGSYAGGLALVGERGPELINFDRPGQVYNAAQTSALLSAADIAAMLAELAALRREVAAMRAESRQGDAAIATNTGKLARYADRWDGEGLPVRNADDTTLQTEAV